MTLHVKVQLVVGGHVVIDTSFPEDGPDFEVLSAAAVRSIGELMLTDPAEVVSVWQRMAADGPAAAEFALAERPAPPIVLEEQTVRVEVEHPTAAKLVRKMRGKIAKRLRAIAEQGDLEAALLVSPAMRVALPIAEVLTGWADEVDAGTFGA